MTKKINSVINLEDSKELSQVNRVLEMLLTEIDITAFPPGRVDLDIMEVAIGIRLMESGEFYNERFYWVQRSMTIQERVRTFEQTFDMEIEDVVREIIKRRGLGSIQLGTIAERALEHKIEMVNGVIVALVGKQAKEEMVWIKNGIGKADKETTLNFLIFVADQKKIESKLTFK